jgi:hypothetical protein
MLHHYYNSGTPEFPRYVRIQTPYESWNSSEEKFPQHLLPERYLHLISQEQYQEKAYKPENIVDEIFEDKVQGLKATIDSTLAQVEERKELRKKNLLGILQGECKCDTELMQLEERLRYSCAGSPGTDKAKATIQKELLNLERERRFEDVSCWRDLVFLRKELVSALGEYQTAQRRQEMLSTK